MLVIWNQLLLLEPKAKPAKIGLLADPLLVAPLPLVTTASTGTEGRTVRVDVRVLDPAAFVTVKTTLLNTPTLVAWFVARVMIPVLVALVALVDTAAPKVRKLKPAGRLETLIRFG